MTYSSRALLHFRWWRTASPNGFARLQYRVAISARSTRQLLCALHSLALTSNVSNVSSAGEAHSLPAVIRSGASTAATSVFALWQRLNRRPWRGGGSAFNILATGASHFSPLRPLRSSIARALKSMRSRDSRRVALIRRHATQG